MSKNHKTVADFKAHIRSLMHGGNPASGIEEHLLYRPNRSEAYQLCLRGKNAGLTPSERAGRRERLARAYAVCDRALASLPASEFLPEEAR
jgi:hypothetical protein